MDLKQRIQEGWAQHATATKEVGAELEASVDLIEATDAAGAAGFMNLVNHVLGDHLGDRARALRVCEAAFARLSELGDKAACMQLAVARELAGEKAGAASAFAEFGGDAPAAVRFDLLVAQGLCNSRQWQESARLYTQGLRAAERLARGHSAERAVAIVSNNVASELLALAERDAAQDQLMEQAAKAARTFWLRVGDWTNDERADYLLASVFNALGRGAEGCACAQRGLATIAANGPGPVDQAFLELALAQGEQLVGNQSAHAQALERAQALAADFDDDGLRTWFATELAKVR